MDSSNSSTVAKESNQQTNEHINKTIRKDVDKIVDKYDIEDIATQCNASQNKTVSYCRCWKSKKVCKKNANSLFFFFMNNILFTHVAHILHFIILFFSFLQFPLCDGSHNAWNKETGDNIGPLVITNKQ